MNDEAVELLREIDAFLRQSSPPHRERDWHKLLTRCLALLAQPKAAPQDVTAGFDQRVSDRSGGGAPMKPDSSPYVQRAGSDAKQVPASAAPDSGMPNCPEINLNNYNLEDVIALNEWAIKASEALSLREREGWIPVSKRVPAPHVLCWSLLDGDVISEMEKRYWTGAKWIYLDGSESDLPVTHWMPMPAAPSVEGD